MNKLFALPVCALALLLSAAAPASAKPAKPGQSATKAVATKKVTLNVTKMHCEGCANGLVQAAKGWTGVKAANVSFATKKAEVTYDPKKTSPAKIAQEFKRVGFPSTVIR